MPITKSAMKRMRSNKKKHARNQKTASRLKTLYKTYTTLVADKNIEKAQEHAQLLSREYDKAASKGIIPQKRAQRKKSRIAKALHKLTAA